ncbi:MAG: hypothetical protein U0790_22930 [Isosphaeraceae bacterium]
MSERSWPERRSRRSLVVGLLVTGVAGGWLAWGVLAPGFRLTLVNKSEGPITDVLVVPGPTAWSPSATTDPGGPRTFERIEQGSQRIHLVPRRSGTTVRIFYKDHAGEPQELEMDQLTDDYTGRIFSGAYLEIRTDRSSFGQFERSWSLREAFDRALYRLRTILGL